MQKEQKEIQKMIALQKYGYSVTKKSLINVLILLQKFIINIIKNQVKIENVISR